jgi:hypothetical protein
MEIPKSAILEFLRHKGDDSGRQEAEATLPETVDTDRDGALLEQFGVDDRELLAMASRVPELKDKLPDGVGDKLGL